MTGTSWSASRRSSAVGDLPDSFREHVGDDERVDGVDGAQGVGVEGADPAEAYQSDTHGSA
jgi:hypothetical protein